MKVEQIKIVSKVISILQESDITSKIYSIDFNTDGEFKVYASFDRGMMAYLKKKKYKFSVMDTGSIWMQKRVGNFNVLIVLW